MGRSLHAVMTLAFFALAAHVRRLLILLRPFVVVREWSAFAAGGIVSALQIVMCVLALRSTRGLRLRAALGELGLLAPVLRPVLIGLAVTAPMLVAFWFTSPVSPQLTVLGVLFGSLLWPLTEEILYRGYAFRQLYARARWGFWPASLVIALAFGIGHLDQIVTGSSRHWVASASF